MIDINLTAVWHTTKATIPRLPSQGDGGSIVLTNSTAARTPYPFLSHLRRREAWGGRSDEKLGSRTGSALDPSQLSEPPSVDTQMIGNKPTYDHLLLDAHDRTEEQIKERFATIHAIPVPWSEPVDVSNAVLFLNSDEDPYVTGTTIVVDVGLLAK